MPLSSPSRRQHRAVSTFKCAPWKRKRQAAVSAAATASRKKHKSNKLTPSTTFMAHKESSYLADILDGLSEKTRNMHAKMVSMPRMVTHLDYPSKDTCRPGTTLTSNSCGLAAHENEEKRKLRSRHRTSIFGRDESVETNEPSDGSPGLDWDTEIVFDSDEPSVNDGAKTSKWLLPDYTVVDFYRPHTQINSFSQTFTSDPLEDELYLKAHRRSEISEKRLKNIEKERLQHERLRLERQLEVLNSPDWRKEVGGHVEVEMIKRRDSMIKEIEQVLDKFKKWKDDSKRRRTNEVADKQQATPEPIDTLETQRSGIKIRIKIPLSMQGSHDSDSELEFKSSIPLDMTSVSKRFVTPEHRRSGGIGGRRSGRLSEEWVFGMPLPRMIYREKEFVLPTWI